MNLQIRKINFWNFFSLLSGLLFLAPLLLIIFSIFEGFNDNFAHIYNVVLLEYSVNSLILLLGVSFFVLLIGLSAAWLTTKYEFPGKKTLEWALILPLAIPPYILAYVFTELFDYSGSGTYFLQSLNIIDEGNVINIRTILGAILVFSFSLYPYVYLISKTSMLNISTSILESAQVLGTNKLRLFFKVILPLLRPAILAGLALVAMETLADFGAVQHFAIPTFTTGIFRTWLGLYDLTTAMQLASMLLFIIFIFLFLERKERQNQRQSLVSDGLSTPTIVTLKGIKGIVVSFICFIPVLIGFLIPVFELISWTIEVPYQLTQKFINASINTITLGLVAGVLTTLISLVLNFNSRITASKFSNELNYVISLGYGIPGLILAIGITQMLIYFDAITASIGFIFTGSIVGLVLAYTIKSYALSNNVIQSTYKQFSTSIDDSARILGTNKLTIMRKVHMPLLSTGLITSLLLVISEVVKELPATLILRPFNFDTLSVAIYILASEERMYEAALPSLLIIIIGLIPIYFISRMIKPTRVNI